MKTSIATVCLSGGLSEKLQAIAAAGFRGVEIFESDLLSYNGTPADVAKEMSDLGLRAITFQPFRDFEGMPDSQRQRTFDRAERKFDLMQELACDLLLVCSNVSPESLGGIDRSAADFRELGERAAKHGLRVGFEALDLRATLRFPGCDEAVGIYCGSRLSSRCDRADAESRYAQRVTRPTSVRADPGNRVPPVRSGS